jgi:hypothetical protein
MTSARAGWIRGVLGALVCAIATLGPSSRAAEEPGAEKSDEARSPWLLLPIVSATPKLGGSVGVLGGYLHYFDSESKVSMFGVAAMYTTTDSKIAGAFAKTSSGKDHHRGLAFVGGGKIKNDYDDFLGTGEPLRSEDDLKAVAGRYLYRLRGNWFVGAQGTYANYQILGQSAFDDEILQTLGLTGFTGGGIGAVVLHDSRDDDNMPIRGWTLNVNDIAYRDWIGGDESFDVYRLDAKTFLEHGDGHVLALRQSNQWTESAPLAAYAPVVLRGYKFGQYLGKYMSSVEAEERLRIAERWTVNVFAGVASLYGDRLDWNDGDNLYASGGAGVQFVVKPKEKLLLNLEYAKGEDDNAGTYLGLGYSY